MTPRQAECPFCHQTIRPGRGKTVDGVRTHLECPTAAQRLAPIDENDVDDGGSTYDLPIEQEGN